MINEYDVEKQVTQSIKDGRLSGYFIKEINGVKTVCSMSKTHSSQILEIISIPDLTDRTRKKEHCDFECIYDEHISCYSVLRCRECGTIIFYNYSDDGPYEPYLRCPVCSDYKTDYEYWTPEEIKDSMDKQEAIKMYQHWTEITIEDEKRHTKRGKYDWQLWNYKYYGHEKGFILELEIDDIQNKFKLKGLRMIIHFISKDKDVNDLWTSYRTLYIPLSWKAFHSQCIYPYKKSTTPSLRKYLLWQKKPT